MPMSGRRPLIPDDAGGKRVEKNVEGVKTDYVYDSSDDAIVEISGSGAISRQELFVGSKHLGTYVNSTTYFSHGDWLGTERVRSDMTGAPCETIQSLPFGDAQFTSGNCGYPSTRHLTGKERDVETGLDYFGARSYASALGRFDSIDPGTPHFADPQSWNRYAYVLNNPLRYIDPDGRESLDSYMVNVIANFVDTRDQLMQAFVGDYRRALILPTGSSPDLQNDIKAAAIFADEDIFSGSRYPMSGRFYSYELHTAEYLQGFIIAEVKFWIANPSTSQADLDAAKISLGGALGVSQSPLPDWLSALLEKLYPDNFSEGTGKAQSLTMRNRLINELLSLIEEAAKKKKEQEKKEKEKEKEKGKCQSDASGKCHK
jgi:RHS repeat-associated protein